MSGAQVNPDDMAAIAASRLVVLGDDAVLTVVRQFARDLLTTCEYLASRGATPEQSYGILVDALRALADEGAGR